MPEHHPSAASRLGYAKAELAAGAALLVAWHLARCPDCVQALEAESGGRFRADEVTPAPASDDGDAVGTFLARAGPGLSHEPWRWAGPGALSASVRGAAGLGEHVYLLKARAGQKLARHGHPGAERVMVLQGAFHDGAQTYRVDDVSERQARDVHALRVADDGECVCLVVNDGPPELYGMGRWVKPFLRL